MNEKYKCDCCGKRNPETFKGGRLTKCCAVTDKKEGCYRVEDENGKTWYAKGKTWLISGGW